VAFLRHRIYYFINTCFLNTLVGCFVEVKFAGALYHSLVQPYNKTSVSWKQRFDIQTQAINDIISDEDRSLELNIYAIVLFSPLINISEATDQCAKPTIASKIVGVGFCSFEKKLFEAPMKRPLIMQVSPVGSQRLHLTIEQTSLYPRSI